MLFAGISILFGWFNYYTVCRDQQIIDNIDRYNCFYLDGEYYSLPMNLSDLPQDYTFDNSYGSYPECLEPGESYRFSLEKNSLYLKGEFSNDSDQIISLDEAVVKKLSIFYELPTADHFNVFIHRRANRLVLYKGINLYTTDSKRVKLLSSEEGYCTISNGEGGFSNAYEIHMVINDIDYIYFHQHSNFIDTFEVEISSE